MRISKINPARNLDPLYSAYTLAVHTMGAYPHKSKVSGKEFIEGRYRKAVAIAHKMGMVTRIGNVERELPAAEFCQELKCLFDYVTSEYDGEAFAYLLRVLKYLTKRRPPLKPVFMNWDWWRQLRDINKVIREKQNAQ